MSAFKPKGDQFQHTSSKNQEPFFKPAVSFREKNDPSTEREPIRQKTINSGESLFFQPQPRPVFQALKNTSQENKPYYSSQQPVDSEASSVTEVPNQDVQLQEDEQGSREIAKEPSTAQAQTEPPSEPETTIESEAEADEATLVDEPVANYWTHDWHTDRFGNEALYIWEVGGKRRYSNANRGYAYIREKASLSPKDAGYDARFEKYKHRPQAHEGKGTKLNWWMKRTPGWDNPEHSDNGTADFNDLAEFKDSPSNKKGTGFYYMGFVFDPLIYEKLETQKRGRENAQYIGIQTNYLAYVNAENGIILHETPSPEDKTYRSKQASKNADFILGMNQRVTVVAEANQDNEGWVLIKNSIGEEGWIERTFISKKAQPKSDQNFDTYTVKKGDTVEGLIKSYYARYPNTTGNDRRTVAMALYLYNKDKSGSGVYRNASKYKSAGSWKDTFDPWMQETRANYASIELYIGGEIILPPVGYIARMVQLGLVEKRPDFANAMIESGRMSQGFIAGVGIGFYDAIIETADDLYQMIVDIFTGEIFTQIADMFNLFMEKGLSGIWEMIKEFGIGTWEEIKAAWNNQNPYERGQYFGEIIGAILFEVVLALITWGVGSVVRNSARAQKILKWFPNINRKKITAKGVEKHKHDIDKMNGDRELERNNTKDGNDRDKDKETDKETDEDKAENAKALIVAKVYVETQDALDPSPNVDAVVAAINKMPGAKLSAGKRYQAKPNGMGEGHFEVFYNPTVKKDYTEGSELNNSGVSANVENARELSRTIPKKWKVKYMCKEYASALKTKLVNSGISGEILEMITGTGFIHSDEFGNIATLGLHRAIKVDDMVFDNLRSNGIPYGEWIKDLGGEIFTNPPHARITKTTF